MKARAFTLIELLVVVAIIALLISILLPSLSSARATARVIKCQSIQKQFYGAAHMYADAHDGHYVPVKTAHGTRGASYYSWLSTADQYGGGVMFRKMMGLGNVNPLTAMPCPDRPDPFTFSSSLAWSWIWIKSPPTAPQPGWTKHIGIKRPLVLLSSTKMMMVDATDWHMASQGNMNYAHPNKWDLWGETKNNSGAYRHKEGANVTHFDGHGSWYHKTNLYNAKSSERRRVMDIYRK